MGPFFFFVPARRAYRFSSDDDDDDGFRSLSLKDVSVRESRSGISQISLSLSLSLQSAPPSSLRNTSRPPTQAEIRSSRGYSQSSSPSSSRAFLTLSLSSFRDDAH